MTSTAAKATSQALTLAKPAAAPLAAKADRAHAAQDRSADFAEVLADKSRKGVRSEEDRETKDAPPARAETTAAPSKPSREDRHREEDGIAAECEPAWHQADNSPEPSPEADADPLELEHAQPVVEHSKPTDVQGDPRVVVGAEVVVVAAVPQKPTPASPIADAGGDHDQEQADAAVSTVPSDESNHAVKTDRPAARINPRDAKRPSPGAVQPSLQSPPSGSTKSAPGSPPARATSISSVSTNSPPKSEPDLHKNVSRGDEAGADEATPGVRTGTPDRPLTIRELNELLVRIDPQWAAKGLALPANVAAANSAVRVNDTPAWDAEAMPAAFKAILSESVPPSQPHFAGSDRFDSTSDSFVQPAARDSGGEQPHGSDRSSNSDRAAAADVAKPAATAADRAVASPAITGASAQLDRASDKPATVAPVQGRNILSIDSARPIAKPSAANPSPGASAQTPAFAAQVQRGLAAAIAQGGGQVTLRLNPQALGQLRVKLDLRADVVKLRFEVGSSAARSLLDEQLPGLGRMLEAQGLRVAHSSVGTDSSLASTHTQTPTQPPPQDANGTGGQFLADGGGQWAGQGADGGAQQRQASENAGGRIEPVETGETPRSGEIHIEREGGVLDPVTLRLNAIA